MAVMGMQFLRSSDLQLRTLATKPYHYRLRKYRPSIPHCIWRPTSLSELTPMIYNTGLTHLGSEASNLYII